MTTSIPPTLCYALSGLGKDIAAEWFDAVARTSFVGSEDRELRRQLGAATGRIMDLLATEPFPRQEAERLGAALSRFQYLRADALGTMLEELAARLVTVLPAEDFVAIQPRLYAVTAGIMVGFLGEDGARVAREQHAIHQALLTAQRQAEVALRVSEDRYRAVITQVNEGIVLTDAESRRVIESNLAFQQLLGYTAVELTDLFLYELIAHDRASVDENIRQTVRNGRHDLGERQCIRKDGTLLAVEASITAIQTASGTLLCSVVRDVSERARAASELAKARQMLGRVREAERLHLAQELHDGAIQELVALHLQLSAASGQAADSRSLGKLLPELSHIDTQLVEVARELRTVVGELRPGGLDHAGLEGALRHYVATLGTAGCTAPEVELQVDRRAGDLPGPAALCLFRVAQEAIHNVFRHAEAQKAAIWFRLRGRTAILRVRDNGRGFMVPERLSLLVAEHHFGLAGMAERVDWAEGGLRVRSRPDKGTTVTAWIPLEGKARERDADSDRGGG